MTGRRRTFDQVRAEGAARERRAVAAYVRKRARAAEIAEKRSPFVSAEEARLQSERIAAIADEIAQGMHL